MCDKINSIIYLDFASPNPCMAFERVLQICSGWVFKFFFIFFLQIISLMNKLKNKVQENNTQSISQLKNVCTSKDF